MAAETMLGFLQEQETAIGTTSLTRAGESMTFAPQDLIPVYNTIAQNFVVFDRWFADVPGPTDPNRYSLSNTILRSSNFCSFCQHLGRT